MSNVLRKGALCALVSLGFGVSGCKLFGGKPAPEGLGDVKSVAKGADEWKDSKGAVWRLADQKLDWEHAADYCKSFAKASKKRWRLPSPDELAEARAGGIASKHNEAFGWVTLGNTWSAEWDVSLEETASGLYINMDDGTKTRTVVDDLEFTTLCVRTDTSQESHAWSDGKGEDFWYLDGQMAWQTAAVSCEELAKRRHQPWRLPSPDELAQAVKDGIQTPKNKAFGRDYLNYTWSAGIAAILDSQQAFALDLRNEKQHLVDVGEELAVICISGSAAGPSPTTK